MPKMNDDPNLIEVTERAADRLFGRNRTLADVPPSRTSKPGKASMPSPGCSDSVGDIAGGV
jgi:hypothetical protein